MASLGLNECGAGMGVNLWQRDLWLSVFCLFACLLGSTISADARRMAFGNTVDDRFIIPNHPAIKAGTLVSPELLARNMGPLLREDFHCFHMLDNGSLGRVTLYGLFNVAQGALPADVFKGKVDSSALRAIAQQNIEGAASYLVSYSMRASNGDLIAARQAVRAAEIRDTKCYSDIARKDRTDAELAAKDLALQLTADGKWVVTMQQPGSGAIRLPRMLRILGMTSDQVTMVERGYRAAYAELDARIGNPATAARPQALPRADPKSQASRPGIKDIARPESNTPQPTMPPVVAKERERIQDAAIAMREALASVKKFCLLRASVAQCG
jgi:hypothetical protein